MIKLLTTDGVAYINPQYIEYIHEAQEYDKKHLNSEIKCTIITNSGRYISVIDLSVNDLYEIINERNKNCND